ncbi:MAG: hypothetical protein V1860_01695 [bacterium]
MPEHLGPNEEEILKMEGEEERKEMDKIMMENIYRMGFFKFEKISTI